MERTLDKTILLLVAIAPLLVPFGLVRNVGLLAILICLTGGLAWWSVVLKQAKQQPKHSLVSILLVVYGLACAISTIANWSITNLFGTPLIRLGSVELLACVGIGLVLRETANKLLAVYLYIPAVVLATISVPYTLYHFHSWVRIGGPFFQSDFLAVVLAVGFLCGVYIWSCTVKYRPLVITTQAVIAAVIFMTQTRAVIGLLFIEILVIIWHSRQSYSRKAYFSLTTIALFCLGILLLASIGGRLHNTAYAANSVSYRVALQTTAVSHLVDRPFIGYGSSNLSKPLACSRLSAPALLVTCHQGYYFDSSHNVFIDRFLMLGWLGGISFMAAVLLLIWRGLRRNDSFIFNLAALMIAAYYCTNIAALDIELLFWICLLRQKIV